MVTRKNELKWLIKGIAIRCHQTWQGHPRTEWGGLYLGKTPINKLRDFPASHVWIPMGIFCQRMQQFTHLTDRLSSMSHFLFPIKGSGDSSWRPFSAQKKNETVVMNSVRRNCWNGVGSILNRNSRSRSGMKWRKTAGTWSWSDSIS